jgi:hypothetical protein
LQAGDAPTSDLLLSKALALIPSDDAQQPQQQHNRNLQQNSFSDLRIVLLTVLAKVKIASMDYKAALLL